MRDRLEYLKEISPVLSRANTPSPSISTVRERFSERWIPSSFVIALLLTLVTFVAALVATPTTPLDAVRHWGDGFWELLERHEPQWRALDRSLTHGWHHVPAWVFR